MIGGIASCRVSGSNSTSLTLTDCRAELYNPLWRFALDGCSLDRPLLQYLLAAGPWERVEIERDAADTSIMPRISGRLVKPVT